MAYTANIASRRFRDARGARGARRASGAPGMTRIRSAPLAFRISIPRLRWPPRAVLPAALAGLVALAWVGAIFAIPDLRFVVVATRAKTGVEVIAAILQLFVALVLALFPVEEARLRLNWVALGFLILGLSGLGFGYLLPLAGTHGALAGAMYGSLLA